MSIFQRSQYIAERYISMERFFELLKNKSDFFDDITTPQKEKIVDIANRAFAETLQILADYSGQEDVEKWSWGNFHVIRFDHFIGKSKLLAPFVNYGLFPFEGDGETNNRARFYEIEPPFVTVSASCPASGAWSWGMRCRQGVEVYKLAFFCRRANNGLTVAIQESRGHFESLCSTVLVVA